MKKRFILFTFLVILIFSLSYLWWQQANAPVNSRDKEYKIFIIKRGEDMRTIAKRLQTEGLIRDPVAFFLWVRYGGLQQKIQSGDFRISPSQSMQSIASTLTHGTLDVWVTTVEGWRSEEIAAILSQALRIPEIEFLKVAREGYMFPDTYLIPKDATAGAVVNLFMNNFNSKVTNDIVEKARKKGFTLAELVTLASMVEREAQQASDRPLVASILLNRLGLGMKLDVDATVQYALGYQADEKTWWKKEITQDDLQLNSPYNTYKNSGLPPGPIANPGFAAILAVVDAPDTNYIFYVSDKKGKIHPARTVEEHSRNVEKYINR